MKILVIYATAGAGHRKAAEAVYQGLKSRGNIGAEFILADSLVYTTPLYKKLYSDTYTFLITKIPAAWGGIFAMLDWGWLQPLVRLIRRIQNTINGRKLAAYLKKEKFDYIISTHFFPNEVAAYLKRKKLIASKIIAVVTDYDVHRIWLGEGIDYYCGACEYTIEKLKKLGVPAERAVMTGIPTDSKFAAPHNIVELKKKLGLKEGIFTVLVATGSFGIGPIEEIAERLPDFQVMIVCGHNQELYKRLSKKHRELLKVFGLVDNMPELMAAADVMITKPGGLSISEALVVGLPMIFFNAIPGQETNNVAVLGKCQVGISNCPVEEMVGVLRRFHSNPQEFQAAKNKSKALGKPNAVQDIINLIK